METLVGIQLALLGISVASLVALDSYWGVRTSAFDFLGPDGWCGTATESFGLHGFGDDHQFASIPSSEMLHSAFLTGYA